MDEHEYNQNDYNKEEMDGPAPQEAPEREESSPAARAGRPGKGGHFKLGLAIGAIAVLVIEAASLGAVTLIQNRMSGTFSGLLPGNHVTAPSVSGTEDQAQTAAGTEDQTQGTAVSDNLTQGAAAFDTALQKKIAEINPYIDDAFIFPVDSDKVLDETLKGYLNGLDDIYSVYYTPDEYKETMESSDGAYVGIGVAVQQDPDTKMITAMTVYPGSPAEKGGMKKGDTLVKVDGEDITGWDLSEVVNRIRGEENTQVTVTVYREGEYLDLTMTRAALNKMTVEYKMLENGIGYILLTEFDAVSVEQIRTAVNTLKNQGMQKLVLDLRDNPGGLLTSVVTIADDFLPKANVFYVEDKQGQRTNYDSEEGEIFEGDMVVLINENSASASEVLSGTLKDNGRATIMGTQSFGKGIVQTFFPLTDGSAIKLTTAHYFTPNGTDIHGVGITPDQVVEDDRETEDDEQLQAALAALGGRNTGNQAASR